MPLRLPIVGDQSRVRAEFMSSDDDPADRDGAMQARFAALFQSFFRAGETRASRAETAFLVTQLAPRRGARVLCCDRSIVLHGWGLAAEGCAISPLSGGGREPFDGAIWSLDELGNPPDAALLEGIAAALAPGARLVIDAGTDPVAAGWRHFPSLPGLAPAALARSPGERRLYSWTRTL